MDHVIITGGTGGLGSAIAATFEETGRCVTSLGRGDPDLADPQAIRDFFLHENQCSLLVCAAGGIDDRTLGRMDPGSWDAVFSLNYMAAARCARAAIPGMVGLGGGHIVFISSQAARHPVIGQAAYASAKAALEGLAAGLAGEVGTSNIRVNAILPGFLETKMTSGVSEKRKHAVIASHHLGRLNTVGAAARFIRFLDENMPHTSGQVFQLDSRP